MKKICFLQFILHFLEKNVMNKWKDVQNFVWLQNKSKTKSAKLLTNTLLKTIIYTKNKVKENSFVYRVLDIEFENNITEFENLKLTLKIQTIPLKIKKLQLKMAA